MAQQHRPLFGRQKFRQKRIWFMPCSSASPGAQFTNWRVHLYSRVSPRQKSSRAWELGHNHNSSLPYVSSFLNPSSLLFLSFFLALSLSSYVLPYLGFLHSSQLIRSLLLYPFFLRCFSSVDLSFFFFFLNRASEESKIPKSKETISRVDLVSLAEKFNPPDFFWWIVDHHTSCYDSAGIRLFFFHVSYWNDRRKENVVLGWKMNDFFFIYFYKYFFTIGVPVFYIIGFFSHFDT